jgi:hypothetical protein
MAVDKAKNGKFAKGHPFYKSRNGIKNGCKKTLKGEVKDALKIAEDAMPKLIQNMIDDAQNPEINANVRQQCREYLIDRIYGKANQPLSGKLSIQTVSWVIGKGYQREPEQLTEGKG